MKFYPEFNKNIINEIKNKGERLIYNKLKDINCFDSWICCHSLYLPSHKKKNSGELDFIIIAPDMLIGLEVKTGLISVSNRQWIYETYKKNESPFQQVNTTMCSLQESVWNFLKLKGISADIPFVSGVLFPDQSFRHYDNIECSKELIFDSSDVSFPMENYLNRLRQYLYRIKSEKRIIIINFDSAIFNNIVSYIVANKSVIPSEIVEIASGIQQIKELTEQQIILFEGCLNNDRIIADGTAGTGKTLIASRVAKLSSNEGRKVGYFCFNKLLASKVRNDLEENGKYLQVWNINAWIVNIYKKKHSFNNNYNKVFSDKSFNEQVKYMIEYLFECDFNDDERFDEIIIDEGQDFLENEYIQILLDLSLKNGLSKGRWRIFLDSQIQKNVFNRQNIIILEKLKQFNPFYFQLTINCRNSKTIINNIFAITGFKQGKAVFVPDGPIVITQVYQSDEEQWVKLIDILKSYDNEKFNRNKIDIISLNTEENSMCYNFKSRLKNNKIQLLNTENLRIKNKMSGAASIYRYKGLENEVIILTDVRIKSTDEERALLYTAMSRAKMKLWILVNIEDIEKLDNLLKNSEEKNVRQR